VRHTESTITTPGKLEAALELTRRRGFADSNGEMIPELRAVAAPIRQHDGQVVAAVNISVPSHRVSYQTLLDQFGPKVVHTSWQISEALGYTIK
jgi:IclR family pca regulon transcriptional regulator